MVKVYELNLPTVNVAMRKTIKNVNSYLGSYLGEVDSSKIDIIVKHNIEEQFEIATNSNEEDDWVDANKQLGELGELLAEAYLKEIYSNVKIVSKNASLGYDIEVNNELKKLQFEVKTARNHFGFHITKNELKKASIYKETYHIFFIKLNDVTVKSK